MDFLSHLIDSYIVVLCNMKELRYMSLLFRISFTLYYYYFSSGSFFRESSNFTLSIFGVDAKLDKTENIFYKLTKPST